MSDLEQNKDKEKQKAEQIEIQIGEPFASQINYACSDQKLLEYVDKQMQLISEGQEELANIELSMLGYAFDFIDFAKRAAQLELKLQEEDLLLFDKLLEAVHNMVIKGEISQETLNGIAKGATGYLGVVIMKNMKADWVQTNIGMAVNFNGTNAFLYNRIARRILNGAEDDMISFYEGIKQYS